MGRAHRAQSATTSNLENQFMNTNGRRSDVISWLNDAYAMVRSLEVMLRKQAENTDSHHAIHDRARIHLDETETHAERVGHCLEMLGETPSTIKSVAGHYLLPCATPAASAA
jgi:ferritin-like metal-binding protein YciE